MKMGNKLVFKMNLLNELGFFKFRIEKIEGNFAKKATAERCNQLIREAKLLLGDKVEHVKEIDANELTKDMELGVDKAEMSEKISQLINSVNDELNAELRR